MFEEDLPEAAASPFPLQLQVLDHYTLIVEDAVAVARFHEEVLGFTPLRIQRVNAGSVPEGEYDMLNHVLQIPGTTRRVLVVTEGLTDESIFRRYMRENGQGVHHVAYEVGDLDSALALLHANGIKTTSDEVLTDPLTGLRQIFVHRDHCGYFLELIERTEAADEGVFTNKNMAALAQTMIQYLRSDAEAKEESPDSPSVTIARPRADVVEFLADPAQIGRWTGHRTVRVIDGRLVEVRMGGDVPLSIEPTSRTDGETTVRYRWGDSESFLEVRIDVRDSDAGTVVEASLADVPPERRDRTGRIIQTELDILGALLEGREDEISAEQRQLIDAYHLEVHQREGL